MADSLEILNAIRDVAGSEYQARIPEATRTNIASIGNTILSYAPSANAFFTGLLNRIGKVVVERMEGVEDIYDVFENGKLEFGDTIQKIFVDIPHAQPFNGTATTAMLSQNRGAIHVEYTKVDRKIFYKTTISVAQLKEAFTSVAKLDEFVRALIESMSTALSYDKYVMLTNTLATHCKYVANAKDLGDSDYPSFRQLVLPADVAVYNSTTGEVEWSVTGAKVFLKLLRVASRSLKFPHALSYGELNSDADAFVQDEEEHDIAGNITVVRTPVNKQVCALEISTMATIDVDALAVLFNIDKAEPKTRMIELEDGALGEMVTGTNETPYHLAGFICDRDAVERGTSFEEKDSFKNPEALYVNMWNHYWGYMAISKFKDFVPILVSYKTVSESEGE